MCLASVRTSRSPSEPFPMNAPLVPASFPADPRPVIGGAERPEPQGRDRHLHPRGFPGGHVRLGGLQRADLVVGDAVVGRGVPQPHTHLVSSLRVTLGSRVGALRASCCYLLIASLSWHLAPAAPLAVLPLAYPWSQLLVSSRGGKRKTTLPDRA